LLLLFLEDISYPPYVRKLAPSIAIFDPYLHALFYFPE
jgi:hypothetical protein